MKLSFKGSIFKKLTLFLTPIVVITFIIAYESISYKNFLHTFQEYFNGLEYSKANNLIISGEKFNILKGLRFDNDLKAFFNSKVEEVTNSLNNNKISKNDAQSILNEINRYALNVDIPKDTLSPNNKDTASLTGGSDFTNGVKLYESKNYKDAISIFSSIQSTSDDYSNASKYLDMCKKDYKSSLLAQADTLAKDDYYTKALSLIKDSYTFFPNDSDLQNKEKSLTTQKENYLANSNKEKQASTSSIVNSITTANINTLSLSSNTSFLVFVSLADQKTYIYKGSSNKWTLSKTFLCSTGVAGKDTPQGVYNITTRGDWFYSPQFKQGGKYWVSFYGNDYLFHSLPFGEDKKTVMDWTLGKKASHGCIRLPIEDSKWIYDNIPSDTKVIIR